MVIRSTQVSCAHMFRRTETSGKPWSVLSGNSQQPKRQRPARWQSSKQLSLPKRQTSSQRFTRNSRCCLMSMQVACSLFAHRHHRHHNSFGASQKQGDLYTGQQACLRAAMSPVCVLTLHPPPIQQVLLLYVRGVSMLCGALSPVLHDSRSQLQRLSLTVHLSASIRRGHTEPPQLSPGLAFTFLGLITAA